MVKIKKVTLIPYEKFEFGVTKPVWVDKDNMHPDPMKLLTWGYDECGDVVSGDYNRSFTKKGKPVSLSYDVSGSHTHHEEQKKKSETIKKYLRSLNLCKR